MAQEPTSPDGFRNLALGIGERTPYPIQEYRDADAWFWSSDRRGLAEPYLSSRVMRSSSFKEYVSSSLLLAVLGSALVLYAVHSWGLVIGALAIAALNIHHRYQVDLHASMDARMWLQWDAHLLRKAEEQVLDEHPQLEGERETEHTEHDLQLRVHSHFARQMSAEELSSPDFRQRLVESETWQSPSDKRLRRLAQRRLAIDYAVARWHAEPHLFANEGDTDDADEAS